MAAAAPVALAGVRKAAILLVILGEEAASKVYANLPDRDLEDLTQEIAELNYIDPKTALAVLEEYHRLTVTQGYIAVGGSDYAKKLLVKTFGEESAQHMLSQVSHSVERSAGKLDSLRKADPQQLAKFLEVEHPQTIALILAHLDPKQASVLLLKLPEAMHAETIKRMAQLRQFSPEMAQKVALILHHRLENVGESVRKEYSGFKAVADLMNRMGPEEAKKILEQVEEEDADLALGIRNLMFTFEDLVTIPAASIREIVSQVDKRQLGLALKGAREDLRAHVFAAMSSRAAEMMKEDMEVMGPVRAREVSGAQSEILTMARKLELEGKIILKIEQGDDLMV